MSIKTKVEKISKSDTHAMKKWTSADMYDHIEKLDKAVKAYKKSFLDIALNLYWLDDIGYCNHKWLKVNDKNVFYKNIADYAFDKYDISRATTYQYIAIVKKFGKINPDTGFIDKLDTKYKDYSSTALIIMSGMNDEQLALCKPEMKIKELKELCKPKIETTDDNGSADGQEPKREQTDTSTENDTLPLDPYQSPPEKKNSQKLFEIKDTEDFEKRSKGIMETIKRTLAQNNGKQYHVDILMTWD